MADKFDEALKAYGVKKYTEAYALFEQIAQQDSNAMVNLALMDMQGLGCEKNLKRALSWFEKAALDNNLKALYNLGTFYEKGMEGSIDNDKALEYYTKGANLGHADSQLKAGILFKQKGQIAESMRYLISAAHNQNQQAQSIITYVSNSSGATIQNHDFHNLDVAMQRSLVEKLIETQIRPTLATDNGGIELVNYIGGETPQIWLNYLGSCSGCHLGSTSTADMLLNYFETMIDKNVILYLM